MKTVIVVFISIFSTVVNFSFFSSEKEEKIHHEVRGQIDIGFIYDGESRKPSRTDSQSFIYGDMECLTK